MVENMERLGCDPLTGQGGAVNNGKALTKPTGLPWSLFSAHRKSTIPAAATFSLAARKQKPITARYLNDGRAYVCLSEGG
jgi:hypothetical protein